MSGNRGSFEVAGGASAGQLQGLLPVGRFPVSVVFHGHAHHGLPEGRTANDVPVFNVCASLMRETFPERPFRIVELDMTTPAESTDRRTGHARRTGDRLEFKVS